MGAETFYNKIRGVNANELFNHERQEALCEEGRGGYTGTIAEKDGFTMSDKPKEIDADLWVDMVQEFDSDDKTQKHYKELKRDFEVYDDKWGDALCVPTEDGFIYCGWASS